ncbi:oligopeptide ABC transporter permease [Paenibacillus sp. FSL L8-0494]|uniref:oligopeptide ABC transporter permease n=1 Tax=Paenibacillus sp. FSL L8-0494 TaxID=2975352 RepID=UPI0030FCC67B
MEEVAKVSISVPDNVFRNSLRIFRKHRMAVVGFGFFVVMALIALLAPFIAPYSQSALSTSFNEGPSMDHWLGTDSLGRDVFSRLIYATRVSLLIGVCSVAIFVVVGTIVGSIAGFLGGKVDMVIMRITDVFLSFPQLIIILVAVSILTPNMGTIIFVLSAFSWAGVARIARGSVLSLKERDFVKAGVALGLSPTRILFRHVIPNALGPIIVNATFGVAGAIMTESALSFLGMGIQPPAASLGNMLMDAQSISVLLHQQWLWLPPGITILLTVLAVNFIGDGLRDALDPRNAK